MEASQGPWHVRPAAGFHAEEFWIEERSQRDGTEAGGALFEKRAAGE